MSSSLCYIIANVLFAFAGNIQTHTSKQRYTIYTYLGLTSHMREVTEVSIFLLQFNINAMLVIIPSSV